MKVLSRSTLQPVPTVTASSQGAVLSPLLSNIYLDPLDHLMAEHYFQMVRYADDFVILCRTEGEALRALALVQTCTAEAGLTLHPVKTRIVDATAPGGFDFLGYHFEQGMRGPRSKSLQKLKDAIRAQTRRCNGHSLCEITSTINRILVGWFAYFKHSHFRTFGPLDGWIRMRLRSILRQRHGGLRSRPRVRSSPLAECFLCRTWAVLPYPSPSSGLLIRSA
ncbi:MAG: reverse transcriptase domain-containing protein [Desulfomonilaceae bacterium]